ncbi:MAG: hypothetical protein IKY91_06600 [Akkermansia sp.]|nr:hypothetical protein [Akkermansia sp.]
MPTTTIVPVWGVTKTGVKGGIITDWDENNEAQAAYIQNETGETIHTKVYDVKKTVTCTLVSKTGEVAPNVGDSVTIEDEQYNVMGVRLIQNNQSAQKYAITLESWTGAPKAPAGGN